MFSLNLFGQINLKISDFKLKEDTITANPGTQEESTFITSEYSTIIKIKKQNVLVTFSKSDINISLDEMCAFISKQLNWISKNNSLIKQKVASDLHGLAQDWLPENKDTITTEEIIKSITLQSVSFLDSESCEINFNDGEIFAGHGMHIDLDSKQEIGEAYME